MKKDTKTKTHTVLDRYGDSTDVHGDTLGGSMPATVYVVIVEDHARGVGMAYHIKQAEQLIEALTETVADLKALGGA